MTRKRRSARERERLFNLHGQRCYICGEPIKTGEAFDLEHIVAWELTRDDSDDNVKPAHKACHKEKTAVDICAIRKADRIRQKHLGLHKPKSRLSHPYLRKKVSGEVVLR